MRIAVLIIGLLLGVVMFLQTVLVAALGDAANDEKTATAGAIGVLMALLWLVGCAFVIPFPIVAVVTFAIAGVLGFAGSGEFPDLAVWGVISLALALLSFFGWRGKRRDQKLQAAERQRQLERDQRLEGLLVQQQSPWHIASPTTPPSQASKVTFPTFCPSCKARNDSKTKFCGECGAPMKSGTPA